MRARFLLLATLALLASCKPAPPPPHEPTAEEVSAVEAKIQNYFRRAVRVPDGVGMRLVDIALSPIPDLLTARLEISRSGQLQRLPIAFSRDGQFMIQGELNDLNADPEAAIMQRINLEAAPSRGAATAPVVVVEYLDLQCPFCAEAHRMLQTQLLREYDGRVRLVAKHFPITSLHPWAESAANATECAKLQTEGLFWHLHDALFEAQHEITPLNLKERSVTVVRDGGGDVGLFERCLENRDGLERVRADIAEGSSIGVRSTPTFVINGRVVEGAVPFESLRAIVDEQLASPTIAAAARMQNGRPGTDR